MAAVEPVQFPAERLRQLSEAIPEAIPRALKLLFVAGGAGLVGVFVGLFLVVLAASELNRLGPDTGRLLWSGVAIAAASLLVLACAHLWPPLRARAHLHQNEELLNGLQGLALQLVATIGTLQALLFKHVEFVGELVETAAPLVTPAGSSPPRAADVSALILAATKRSAEVVSHVHVALREADVEALVGFAAELQKARGGLENCLGQPFRALSGPLSLSVALRTGLLEYLDAMQRSSAGVREYAEQTETILKVACEASLRAPFLARLGCEKALDQARRLKVALALADETTKGLRSALADADPDGLRRSRESLARLARAW